MGQKKLVTFSKKKPRIEISESITVGEAAKFLNVHPSTLRRWSDAGLLPVVRLGSRRDRRFFLEDVERFLGEGKGQSI